MGKGTCRERERDRALSESGRQLQRERLGTFRKRKALAEREVGQFQKGEGHLQREICVLAEWDRAIAGLVRHLESGITYRVG